MNPIDWMPFLGDWPDGITRTYCSGQVWFIESNTLRRAEATDCNGSLFVMTKLPLFIVCASHLKEWGYQL